MGLTPHSAGSSVRVAGTGAWRETHTYADGLAATVGKPVLFQPTSTAAGHAPRTRAPNGTSP
ncbi:hypothetical protein [Streptomyces violascens]|uniref:hypothetical protein n=1 Tax=Streptomyces violascens TaxID=67381 RepID=UPI003680EB03